ncbi:MAG TPA: M56 family metallopeptidase [Candidatus Limnocylindria bacterium]|jgi:beta-lactamase regulating signal transducer with metallopeptidase domain|nr:M56 family metallopeptidase [Candidatus Limnocylindria bacterium]
MNLELFSHRLLGALFNGGYQGLLLTLSVWLGLKLVSRSNAATRHAVWLVTLLAVAALPVAHFFGPPASLTKTVVAGTSPVVTTPAVATSLPDFTAAVKAVDLPTPPPLAEPLGPVAPLAEKPPSAGVTLTLDGLLTFPELKPAMEAVESLRVTTPSPTLAEVAAAVAAANEESATSGDDTELRPAPSPSFLSRVWQLTLPGRAGLVLAGAWLLLVVVRLGSLGLQVLQLHLLKRHGASASVEVGALFATLNGEMAPGRPTRLMLYPGQGAPMAVGFFRPAVLLPERVLAEAATPQLQQVLRHELAHVARRDDWANLAQQVVVAVLFYHPAVWWLSRRLTVEREIACDDHVLAATRTPCDYALFLTDFASRMRGRDVVAAPAAWNNKHQLTERIAMILDPKRNASPRLARASVGLLTTATAMAAVIALFAGPRLALAGESADSTDPTAGQEAPEADEVSSSQDQSVAADPASGTAVVTTVSADVAFKTPTTTTLVATVSDDDSGPRLKLSDPTASSSAFSAPPAPPAPNAPLPQPVPPAVTFTRPVRVAYAPQVSSHPVVAIAALPSPSPTASPRIMIARRSETSEDSLDELPPLKEKHGKKEAKEAKEASDRSLEHRLDRLEHQMAELLALQKGMQWQPKPTEFQFKFDQNFDQKKFAKAMEDAHRSLPSEADIAQMREQAKRDAERATREVEKAVRDAQRASAMDAAKAQGNDQQAKRAAEESFKQSFEKQRHEIEAQRNGLEKQMEALEKQMEKLEEAQERMKEHAEHERERADREREKREKRDGKPEVKHDNGKPADPFQSDNNNDNDDSAPKKKEVGR